MIAVKTLPKRFLGEYMEPMYAARIRHEVRGCLVLLTVAVNQLTRQRVTAIVLCSNVVTNVVTSHVRSQSLTTHTTSHAQVDVYRSMGQSLNVAHLEAAFEDDVAVSECVFSVNATGVLFTSLLYNNTHTMAAGRPGA